MPYRLESQASGCWVVIQGSKHKLQEMALKIGYEKFMRLVYIFTVYILQGILYFIHISKSAFLMCLCLIFVCI